MNLSSGNILESQNDCIVIPVNTVGVAGAGLALTAKILFPEWHNSYRNACKSGDLLIGRIHFYKTAYGKYIVSFPTKDHWKNDSRLSYIDIGMACLVDFINRTEEIKTVSIPSLGVGLGHLQWTEVLELITKRVEDIRDDVDVTLFRPNWR